MSMMTFLTVLLLAIPMQSKCNDHKPFMVIMAIITAIMGSIYGGNMAIILVTSYHKPASSPKSL